MISIRIVGHDYKYQVEDVIRLFYQDEINYLEKEPPEIKRGIFISSEIIMKDENALVKTGFYENQSLCDYLEALMPVIVPKDKNEHEYRKLLKREVKRQIYMILSKYTGRKLPWGILTGIRPAKIVCELFEKDWEKDNILYRLKDYYMLSEKKAELLYEVAKTEYEILSKSCSQMISLYVGIPFCTSRCLYCSFTSNSAAKYSHMMGRYLKTLETEMKYVAEIIKDKGLRIQSIYIGGGTPTSIEVQHLDKLLTAIETIFDLDYLEEYTLEAGRPDSMDAGKLEVIKNSRVDRISINPQTMNNEVLTAIGRNHSSEDVVRIFNLAREMGFENINMDVIVGLPGESMVMFENSLAEIEKLSPDSLTVHTMAVKRASKLKDEIGKYNMISEEEASDMVDMAGRYAMSMGMRPYYLYRQKNILGNLENIGYSKKGFESIYNIQIMEERQTIIALGAGAATKVVYPDENRIERAFNVKSVEEYINRIGEMIKRKKDLMF